MIKLKIYIIEDEAILATLLKCTLQSLGHTVCGMAESYAGAIADLHTSNADLIISDIMLKGHETGIDIARYVKQNLNIPLIFLSSISDDDMIKDAMSTKPVSFLKKPVNKECLQNAITSFVVSAQA